VIRLFVYYIPIILCVRHHTWHTRRPVSRDFESIDDRFSGRVKAVPNSTKLVFGSLAFIWISGGRETRSGFSPRPGYTRKAGRCPMYNHIIILEFSIIRASVCVCMCVELVLTADIVWTTIRC